MHIFKYIGLGLNVHPPWQQFLLILLTLFPATAPFVLIYQYGVGRAAAKKKPEIRRMDGSLAPTKPPRISADSHVSALPPATRA